MKSTGIVRNVDTLGRIIIPKEIRKVLSINSGDALEFFTENEDIYIRKYSPGCVFCGSMNGMIIFKDLYICKECKEDLISLKVE
ncbi:AbrB/MazE/SpoVT family DNA-binding domain-containing protein [Clostridium sp. WILCCON 0269]|uniref:AbrB/MazE/SpoVT family DNA-binding domain-containing protein n=1 Tax=Candidatus Clostridium eludens TaxID=3381663 RepID=A0ABW8SG94_9CLOT